jgi:hypothetical protein
VRVAGERPASTISQQHGARGAKWITQRRRAQVPASHLAHVSCVRALLLTFCFSAASRRWAARRRRWKG